MSGEPAEHAVVLSERAQAHATNRLRLGIVQPLEQVVGVIAQDRPGLIRVQANGRRAKLLVNLTNALGPVLPRLHCDPTEPFPVVDLGGRLAPCPVDVHVRHACGNRQYKPYAWRRKHWRLRPQTLMRTGQVRIRRWAPVPASLRWIAVRSKTCQLDVPPSCSFSAQSVTHHLVRSTPFALSNLALMVVGRPASWISLLLIAVLVVVAGRADNLPRTRGRHRSVGRRVAGGLAGAVVVGAAIRGMLRRRHVSGRPVATTTTRAPSADDARGPASVAVRIASIVFGLLAAILSVGVVCACRTRQQYAIRRARDKGWAVKRARLSDHGHPPLPVVAIDDDDDSDPLQDGSRPTIAPRAYDPDLLHLLR